MTYASIPDLWLRARTLYDAVRNQFGAGRDLAARHFDSRTTRDMFLAWLIPVERLVRGLLIAGAITHLLMTESGRKLRQTSIKMKIPERKPPLAPAPPPSTHSRMLVIPNVYRPLPPAPPEPPRTGNAAKTNAADWRVAFSVLRWDLPEPEEAPPKQPSPPKKPPRLMLMSNDPYELALQDQRFAAKRRARDKLIAARLAVAHTPSQGLANRFEALRRVIANPAPHILRLAKFIAQLPEGVLANTPPDPTVRRLPIPHGWPELLTIAIHMVIALYALRLSG